MRKIPPRRRFQLGILVITWNDADRQTLPTSASIPVLPSIDIFPADADFSIYISLIWPKPNPPLLGIMRYAWPKTRLTKLSMLACLTLCQKLLQSQSRPSVRMEF